MPSEWTPHIAGLEKLKIGKGEVILTVPIFSDGVRVSWRAKPTDAFIDIDVEKLTQGEDRIVKIGECETPVAMLLPGNSSSNSICYADSNCFAYRPAAFAPTASRSWTHRPATCPTAARMA